MCSIYSRNSFKQGNWTKMERWIEWANIFFACEIQFVWCFYSFFGTKSVTITNKILIKMVAYQYCKLKLMIYLLVNLYNSNTELEQLETGASWGLSIILLKFDAIQYNHIIFSGDFNIFFNAFFEITHGNAKLETRTVGQFLEKISLIYAIFRK